MALSRSKKNEVVAEVAALLDAAKMTVIAEYQGTTVKAIQGLRKTAKENGTRVTVIKNRLVIKALESTEKLQDVDTTAITGQLLYAFNAEDEVAPAQALAAFAKTNPTMEFVGAITADGQFLGVNDVKALAALPTKDQLRGQLVGTIAAPLTSFMRVVEGNLKGVLYALNARADALGE